MYTLSRTEIFADFADFGQIRESLSREIFQTGSSAKVNVHKIRKIFMAMEKTKLLKMASVFLKEAKICYKMMALTSLAVAIVASYRQNH